jgi:hypothetical protein
MYMRILQVVFYSYNNYYKEIQLNGEECVSREEFESLKEEVAGQLEKRDQDIRSLKRGA